MSFIRTGKDQRSTADKLYRHILMKFSSPRLPGIKTLCRRVHDSAVFVEKNVTGTRIRTGRVNFDELKNRAEDRSRRFNNRFARRESY